MTDFGKAGIKTVTVGKSVKFNNRLQIPWGFVFDREPDLISLISELDKSFCFLESISVGGSHEARMIYNKTGTMVDIDIDNKEMLVYPTSNDHQECSEKIYAILTKHFNGKLIRDEKQ